jgi:hypothetical protein
VLFVLPINANRFPSHYSPLPRLNSTAVSPGITAGYYSWNWAGGSEGPSGGAANFGVAFTGLIDPQSAIADYSTPPLKGTHYICIGGGNAAGMFTASALTAINQHCSNGAFKQAGYAGIVYDVEEVVGDMSMVDLFRESFQVCKQSGLTVIVTTSHSAPYQTSTPDVAVALVKEWVRDKNIDAISPQLYTSGQEGAPDFTETYQCKSEGCTWALYPKAPFPPSGRLWFKRPICRLQ